jgi:hypothetical protein
MKAPIQTPRKTDILLGKVHKIVSSFRSKLMTALTQEPSRLCIWIFLSGEDQRAIALFIPQRHVT